MGELKKLARTKLLKAVEAAKANGGRVEAGLVKGLYFLNGKINVLADRLEARIAATEARQETSESKASARLVSLEAGLAENSERVSQVESRQEEVARLKVQAAAASQKADNAKGEVAELRSQIASTPRDMLGERVADLETTYGALDSRIAMLGSMEESAMAKDINTEIDKIKRVVAGLKKQVDALLQAPAQAVPAAKPEPAKEKPKLQAVAKETVPEPAEATLEAVEPEVDVVLCEDELLEGKLRNSAKELKGKISSLAQEMKEEIEFEPVGTLDEELQDAEDALKYLAGAADVELEFEAVGSPQEKLKDLQDALEYLKNTIKNKKEVDE